MNGKKKHDTEKDPDRRHEPSPADERVPDDQKRSEPLDLDDSRTPQGIE